MLVSCSFFLAFFLGACCGTAPSHVDCGNIHLNGTVINVNQFSNCRSASSLYILGTNLTTLSPFKNLEKIVQHKDAPAIIIAHNDKLRWKSGDLPKLTEITVNRTAREIVTISIYDNPNLCIPSVVINRLKEVSGGEDVGNTFIQDCRCDMQFLLDQATKIGASTSDLCVVLSGGLQIDRSSPESLKNVINNIRVIIGGLSMENSSWKSLNLPALESIKNSSGTAIYISNNKNLQEVHVPLLEVIEGNGTYVNIRNNSVLRMSHVMKEKISLTRFSTPDILKMVIETPDCVVNSTEISSELNSCSTIKGDITITKETSEDRKKLEHLSAVQRLEGCLTIRGTNLEDLLFLRALKEVHCKKDQPPILIEGNEFLVDIELGVHSVRSSYRRSIQIKGNKHLCSKVVEKWQALLEAVSSFSDTVAVIELHGSGKCGDRYADDGTTVIIPVIFALSTLAASIFIAVMETVMAL